MALGGGLRKTWSSILKTLGEIKSKPTAFFVNFSLKSLFVLFGAAKQISLPPGKNYTDKIILMRLTLNNYVLLAA